MGSSYCSICAYPMVTSIPNGRGCLPEVVPFTNCQVENCAECQNTNTCAVCTEGYSLVSNGSCTRNPCDLSSNCALCSSNNNFCFLCNNGTYQSTLFNKTCSTVPEDYACLVDGCAICETSTTCMKCYDMFYLTNDGLCKETVCSDNCLLCYANATCSICRNGYYRSMVDNSLECLPTNSTSAANCSGIDYCQACTKNSAGTVQCNACLPGFMPNDDKNGCIPQVCNVANCQACLPSTQNFCLACIQGYFVNPYYQCVPFNPTLATSTCDIYNCIFCGSNNTCVKCLIGYNTTENGQCITDEYCDVANCGNCTKPNVCYSCKATYLLGSNNVCSPDCNISNCALCSSFTECSTCAGDLIPASDSKSCVCPDTYISTGNTTCGCPTDFTESSGTCFNCTTPGNCTTCSSTNKCGVCLDSTFIINDDGNCVCPDDTFSFTNSSCQCPT